MLKWIRMVFQQVQSMAQLYLSFWAFTIQLGNKPVTQFQSDKVRALLAYLAVEAVSRTGARP